MNLVINHLVEAFKHLAPSSEPFFRDSAVKALAIGVKGVKLVYGDRGDLSDLLHLLDDEKRGASSFLAELEALTFETCEGQEAQKEVLDFFKTSYYAFIYEEKETSPVYAHSEMARDFLKSLLADPEIKNLLTCSEDESIENDMLSFERLMEEKMSFVCCLPPRHEAGIFSDVSIGEQWKALNLTTESILSALLMTRFYYVWRAKNEQEMKFRPSTEWHQRLVYLTEPFILGGAFLKEQLTFGLLEQVVYHLSCTSLDSLKLKNELIPLMLNSHCCHKLVFPGISEKDWTLLEPFFPDWQRGQVQALPFPEVAYSWRGETEVETMILELEGIDSNSKQLLDKESFRIFRTIAQDEKTTKDKRLLILQKLTNSTIR